MQKAESLKPKADSSSWKDCKNILCIRPDNMGDLVMSVPAIRALKESTSARITVLTSSMAAGVGAMIPEIDEVMVCDVPWVKTKEAAGPEVFTGIVQQIRLKKFDAAVIFTVYSQNPMPTIMLAWLAGIPRRLAYCRENPYELLTDWVPDREPYSEIKHQVRRDLDLVGMIGATTSNEDLSLNVPDEAWPDLQCKLQSAGIDTACPFLILHPGVSEKKREYPEHLWIEAGQSLSSRHQLLITGGPSEQILTDRLEEGIGSNAFSLAGKLTLIEFVLLLKKSVAVVSVNTGTIHLAAAVKTPLVVLYALTNPQHFPWKADGQVLTFEVASGMGSRNEVIGFVNRKYFSSPAPVVKPEEIINAVDLIISGKAGAIPELPF